MEYTFFALHEAFLPGSGTQLLHKTFANMFIFICCQVELDVVFMGIQPHVQQKGF